MIRAKCNDTNQVVCQAVFIPQKTPPLISRSREEKERQREREKQDNVNTAVANRRSVNYERGDR
jgi:hypothetical protein